MRPIACDPSAFSSKERARHDMLAERIFSHAIAHEVLENGYAFQLPLEFWPDVSEWVPLERLCCPFFDFTLRLQADDALWLHLTGEDGAGVKALIEAEMLQSD